MVWISYNCRVTTTTTSGQENSFYILTPITSLKWCVFLSPVIDFKTQTLKLKPIGRCRFYFWIRLRNRARSVQMCFFRSARRYAKKTTREIFRIAKKEFCVYIKSSEISKYQIYVFQPSKNRPFTQINRCILTSTRSAKIFLPSSRISYTKNIYFMLNSLSRFSQFERNPYSRAMVWICVLTLHNPNTRAERMLPNFTSPFLSLSLLTGSSHSPWTRVSGRVLSFFCGIYKCEQ